MELTLDSRPELAQVKEPISAADAAARLVDHRAGPDAGGAELAIVLVAYVEPEVVTLVDSVLEQAAGRAEVIVVDNGLDEDTRRALEQRPIAYARAQVNTGASGGRNIGAALATAPILAFIDADGEIMPGYVDAVLEGFRDQRVLAIRGRVLPLSDDTPVPVHYDLGDEPFPAPIVTEGASAWRRAEFVEAGGFEEQLYGHEGHVLTYRLVEWYDASPEQFMYIPGVVLRHDFATGDAHLDKAMRTRRTGWHVHLRYPLMRGLRAEFTRLDPREGRPEVPPEIAAVNEETRKRLVAEEQALSQSRRDARVSGRAVASPALSIVIPVFNTGAVMEETLESALSQTLEDLEIVVVDDGSTDEETREILDRWSEIVTVIRHDGNKGLPAARNTGIAASRGPALLCLDSDDMISATYCEEIVNALAVDDRIGIVSCWVEMFGYRRGVWRPADAPDIVAALVGAPIPVGSGVRRRVWEDAGGWDESFRRGYEDVEFWVSAFPHAGTVRVIPHPHFRYRTRRGTHAYVANENAVENLGRVIAKHHDLYATHLGEVLPAKEAQYVRVRERVQAGDARRRRLEKERDVALRRLEAAERREESLRASLASTRRQLKDARHEAAAAYRRTPRGFAGRVLRAVKRAVGRR